MRLKEEAAHQIRSGVGLIQTATTDRTNNPTEALIGQQWISSCKNFKASRVDQQETTTIHQQHLHLILNNNLDNSKTGCKVDSNSNHSEDDNRTTHMLAVNRQHLQSNINVPMEDTISSASSPDDDDVGNCEDSIKSPHSEESESATSSLDSDEDVEIENTRHTRRGILNPNYPGFQRYAKRLCQEEERNGDELVATGNINNNKSVELNQLDGVVNTLDKSFIYTKPKLNIVEDSKAREVADEERQGKEVNVPSVEVHSSKMSMEVSGKNSVNSHELKMKVGVKTEDAYLSGAKEDISVVALLPSKMFEERELAEEEKFTREEREPMEVLNGSPRKRDKMEINYGVRMAVHSQTSSTPDVIPQEKGASKQTAVKQPSVFSSGMPGWAKVSRREGSSVRNVPKRRIIPAGKEKWRGDTSGSFDVYNIETAMPKIDLDAIESHLRAAKEEESRRRNDREEIRRRLAMDPDDYYGSLGERQGRKPSLQSRLQSGMNLQICFMNETVSDGESPSASDGEAPSLLSSSLPSRLPSSRFASAVERGNQVMQMPSATEASKPSPPRSLSLKRNLSRGALTGKGVLGRWDILGSGGNAEQNAINWDMEDFFSRQARLQAEARMALAQAKEMAHMQMEVERQRQKINSPITQMVRASLLKVGQVFPADRRRVSRQMLTEMNVAQLQVIVNDLHSQIEVLNEDLVKLLMERDDLHMEQDSMLVDIEDLTRYLSAKEKALKESGRGVNREETDSVGRVPSLPLLFRPKTSNQQQRIPKK